MTPNPRASSAISISQGRCPPDPPRGRSLPRRTFQLGCLSQAKRARRDGLRERRQEPRLVPRHEELHLDRGGRERHEPLRPWVELRPRGRKGDERASEPEPGHGGAEGGRHVDEPRQIHAHHRPGDRGLPLRRVREPDLWGECERSSFTWGAREERWFGLASRDPNPAESLVPSDRSRSDAFFPWTHSSIPSILLFLSIRPPAVHR